jgi:hypothetical protein
MLLLYYSSQIYVKLIRKILFKFKFKKNIILKLVNNKFYFLFFKVIKISICNKTQFISVPTYKDYFISSIMKNVLEEIFEKTLNFSAFKSSYAFFDEIRH